jgi:predicted  nucleic acid-binding Zn-ribbon protein
MENVTKEQLQQQYNDLVSELEYARKRFHGRVNQLADCSSIESLERLEESCEFWAGDIAEVRRAMFHKAERISELEAGQ